VQQYIIRRVLLNFLVIFLVATMVFFALRIDSSNVVSRQAGACQGNVFGGDPVAEAQQCKEIARAQLGLDHSIPVQYWDYMKKLAPFSVGIGGKFPFVFSVKTPDLGRSFKSQNPVLNEIKQRVAPTIELGLLEILVAVIVALPIGIISAIRQDTWVDYILRFVSIAFLGIPIFVIALVTIIVTSRFAGGTVLPDWFGPHQTYYSLASDPYQNLKIMFAPAIIGGLGTGAVIMRFLRSQMLEVLRQDYVRTAWSKGLRERVVISRHALKNALIPVLTLIGILLGSIVSANIVLETIYTIPGIGNYVVFAVAQNPDFPVIQGIVIVVATTLVFINLLVDVAYGWLDPRIRYS
jgi:peptide/nickel transport system permease protein